MQILLDTNVILDLLLKRSKWLAAAEAIWEAHVVGTVSIFLSASSVTDIYYLVRKQAGLEAARVAIPFCLNEFEIISVDKNKLRNAFTLLGSDFEDDLQTVCAAFVGLDAIITRDKSGFHTDLISVKTPNELIAELNLAKDKSDE